MIQKHGTYIGRRRDLKGKTAILQMSHDTATFCKAQFDEFQNVYSHGWFPFAVSDFEIDPPVVWPKVKEAAE